MTLAKFTKEVRKVYCINKHVSGSSPEPKPNGTEKPLPGLLNCQPQKTG